MKSAPWIWTALAAVTLVGCKEGQSFDDWMPGKPKIENVWKPPTEITDFTELFKESCQGCHGYGTVGGAAIALDNPTYLSIISAEQLNNIIANGVKGTTMPAFAIRNGGLLTDEQIDIMVKGILAWKGAHPAPAGPFPPYAAPLGNPANGEKVYAEYLAAALKREPLLAEPEHPTVPREDFLSNFAFLDLVTDQYLRTLIIAGHPEMGLANWKEAIPGKPLSDQEISDMVAWLSSKRLNEFGRPAPQPTPELVPTATPAPTPATEPAPAHP